MVRTDDTGHSAADQASSSQTHLIDDITAIVVAFGAVDLLRRCIDHLHESGVSRIIVWDNSQSARDRYVIDSMASLQVTVLRSGVNEGFGRGNNRAVALADSDHVLLVNPDCMVNAVGLVHMAETLTGDSTVGVVAPRMRYADGTRGFAGGGRPSLCKELLAATRIDDFVGARHRRRLIALFERLAGRSSGGLLDTIASGGPVTLHWVSGFCLLLRRIDYAKIGGFDDRYFLYFEDVDLCERLSREGRSVVLDRRAEMLHFESSTATGTKSAHYWGGLATYFSTHGAPIRSVVARMMSRISR